MESIRKPSHADEANREKKFKKAPTIRRLVAFLLDLVLLVISAGMLYTIAIRPIATSLPSYELAYQEFKDVLYDSELYEPHETMDYIKIYENEAHDFYYIDEKLASFYARYDAAEHYPEVKADHIEATAPEERLFYFSETSGEYLPVESKLSTASMDAWLKRTVDTAIAEILEYSDPYLEKATVVSRHFIRQIAVTLIATTLIFYLVFPLIFKGPTIGKKLMGIRIYNFRRKTDAPSPAQLLVRYFFFVLIEILIGIYTLGLVPLLSFLIAAATKKGQAFHDFIASTSVCEPQEETVDPEDGFARQAQAIQSEGTL